MSKAPLTQKALRERLAPAGVRVQVQLAQPGDGSPELAHGDTFVSALDATGAPRKMPFATILTKDYPGFDEASRLTASGLFRLNLDLGREVFAAHFGFEPRATQEHLDRFELTARDTWFPHPVYGAHGWASIIAPTGGPTLDYFIAVALERALR